MRQLGSACKSGPFVCLIHNGHIHNRDDFVRSYDSFLRNSVVCTGICNTSLLLTYLPPHKTALVYAIQVLSSEDECISIAKLLLSHGVSVNYDTASALILAIRLHFCELVSLLLAAGANYIESWAMHCAIVCCGKKSRMYTLLKDFQYNSDVLHRAWINGSLYCGVSL